MTTHPPSLARRLALPLFSLLVAALVVIGLSYKVYGIQSLDGLFDTIKNTNDYQSVLLVNVLVGLGVALFISELKWDALRVTLTVIVALIFGYLVTASFSLNEADRFAQGEVKVKLTSAVAALPSLSYGDKLTVMFNDPDDDPPLTEVSYEFAGRAGDVVNVLAYAEDPDTGLDVQVALIGPDGTTLAEATNATEQQLRTFRRDLTSERDAPIEEFTLPADGNYTIVCKAESTSPAVEGEITVRLRSEAEPPVDLAYGTERGTKFNEPNVKNPVKQVAYRFSGGQGDTITLIAAAARQNIDINVQMALVGPDGQTLAESIDTTPEQVQAYGPDLQSTRDALIENYTLPADGIYTVQVQPEPISRSLRLKETFAKTRVAYEAFLLGPLNRLNRWVDWIRDALTLILLGLAISIVFRAQQFSLGAEGQLYFGALVSGVITLSFGELPKTLLVPLAVLSAATAGFLWGLLPGALKAYLGANELVSTLMLNTIATRFYEMVLTFQLQPPDAGYTASDWIPASGLLTPIIDSSGVQITIAVYLVMAMVILTWLLIQRTPIGYEIRMIGANIKFADYGGVNTKRTIMLAMALSGIIAGLAGAHLALGVHRKLILNISLGLAFEGVVVALLARNNPLVVPFTGLLYAYLRTGARFMESDANISFEVVRIIQAVIILLITAQALVTIFQRRRIHRRGTIELDISPPPGDEPALSPQQPGEGTAHAV